MLNFIHSEYGLQVNIQRVINTLKRDKTVFEELQSNVTSILSINCGTADCEQFFVEALFPNVKDVHHTDIEIRDEVKKKKKNNPHGVIEMDAKTALIEYKDKCDLVLCFFPYFKAVGYKGIIKNYFKGKYFIFYGEFDDYGHCDPEDEFIFSLRKNLNMIACHQVISSLFIGLIEYIVVFRKYNTIKKLKLRKKKRKISTEKIASSKKRKI